MIFSLAEISEAENKLIAEAKSKYGTVYENTENLVFLLWDFLKYAVSDFLGKVSIVTSNYYENYDENETGNFQCR